MFMLLRILESLCFIPVLKRIVEDLWSDKNIEMQKIWQTVISDYTRCILTVHSDKLIAIAGLASSFISLTGMIYFEGIWIESVCFGLAWKANGSPFKVVCRCGKKS